MTLAMLLPVLLGCNTPQPAARPIFVRGGVIHQDSSIEGTMTGSRVDDNMPRWFSPISDDGAQTMTISGTSWQIPEMPSCAPLFGVDLGDVSRHIALGGAAPDTVMTWSHDGSRLAIGTFLGEVIIVDGWTGKEHGRVRLSETMIKQIKWSRDDSQIYVAEQSPDAALLAMDPSTLSADWRLNLADWVQTSSLPAGDLYGTYTLPAAYGLDVLEDGTLLVVATHAWNDRDGKRLNQSIVLQVSPEGSALRQWPETPTDAVFFRARVAGSTAVIPVSRSSSGAPPEGLPVGGVIIFDTETFTPTSSVTVPPLAPWFTNTFLWEAIDLQGDRLFLGMGDGRAGLWSVDGNPIEALPSSTPVLAGNVPIVASIGSGFLVDDRAVYQTSSTHIPFGAAAPELRPPVAHPEENSLVVASTSGEKLWSWSGPHTLEGITLGPDQRTLVVGTTKRRHDTRRDLFGALLFDLGRDKSSRPSLLTFCSTGGPAFFRTASTLDGRIAVAEHPYRQGEDPAFGQYRVTVFR